MVPFMGTVLFRRNNSLPLEGGCLKVSLNNRGECASKFYPCPPFQVNQTENTSDLKLF